MGTPTQEAAAAALKSVAEQLIQAGGDDKRISRADARKLTASLTGEEADLAAKFFRFVDDRDDAVGAVVTVKDVEASAIYAEQYLIRQYDLDGFDQNNSSYFSYPKPARVAFELVSILKRIGKKNADSQGKGIEEELDRLTQGLYFDYLGSEAAIDIKTFYKAAEIEDLTIETFAQLMDLDQSNPDEVLDRFFRVDTDPDFWPAFISTNAFAFNGFTDRTKQATELKEYMEKHLTQLTAIVQGQDNVASFSEHPTFIVGLTSDGTVAGFETAVVWT